MNGRLPLFALLLGLAGLLPFVGTGLGALGPSDGSARWLLALLAYGAVILAFLGGVHWGFVLGGPSDRQVRWRLGFGVLPSLVGWVALLVPIFLRYSFAAEIGIGVEIAGFAGVMLAEQRLYRQQLMPAGYLWLRWGLSFVVITLLAIVLVLRLLGAHLYF
jgi:hypothetical protein